MLLIISSILSLYNSFMCFCVGFLFYHFANECGGGYFGDAYHN